VGGEKALDLHSTKTDKDKKMAKKKNQPVCIYCGTHEGLFITFGNGEKLPSFVMEIGKGIACKPCNQKNKAAA